MAHKHKPKSEAEWHREIGVAIQELVRKGLLVELVDNGQRQRGNCPAQGLARIETHRNKRKS
jgi:hypothetical protein